MIVCVWWWFIQIYQGNPAHGIHNLIALMVLVTFTILIKHSHCGFSWYIVKQPQNVSSFGGGLFMKVIVFTLSFTCGWFKFFYQFHSVVSESLELILWVSAFSVLLAGNKKHNSIEQKNNFFRQQLIHHTKQEVTKF